MKKITVPAGYPIDKMVLSYDSTMAIVNVGRLRYEFDLELLWDLAKFAILNSTSEKQGIRQRQTEALASAIREVDNHFPTGTHIHQCPCCPQRYICQDTSCTLPYVSKDSPGIIHLHIPGTVKGTS